MSSLGVFDPKLIAALYFSYRAVEGKVITSLVTREDTIVYANTTHEDFAKHVRGQRVVKVGRLGKYFYVSDAVSVPVRSQLNSRSHQLALQTAPHILLHLGKLYIRADLERCSSTLNRYGWLRVY
jgi:hypothetical protein